MAETKNKKLARLFEIIEVGAGEDKISRGYDLLFVFAIIINLVASFLFTFDNIAQKAGTFLTVIEIITVVFFAIDYILRVVTAGYLYPKKTRAKATGSYITSFTGIVDLLSFLPYFLPVFFPAGIVAFRMIRVVRIFRLFRLNVYYDSLNVITEVLRNKKQQLLSSVFILIILVLASSLCMYSVEHPVQPDVFKNAFSGIWWSVSTLLTVGYGDIYPITVFGRILGIIITFLGVGMVAIPTGIISAGFVEQYSLMKKRTQFISESDVRFIRVKLSANDVWTGKNASEIALPKGLLLAAVRRGNDTMIPNGDVILLAGDVVVIGAEPFTDSEQIDMQEVTLSKHHPWAGMRVKDLDISRQTLLVMARRGDQTIIPSGRTVLQPGDRVFVYSESKIDYSNKVEV